MREGEIDPLITKWVGNSFLLDYDALNGNKPRLKINYQPWLPYLQQEDQPIEPPTLSWSAGLPQSVVGFQGGGGGGLGGSFRELVSKVCRQLANMLVPCGQFS